MKVLRIIARLNVGGPAKHVVWLTDRLQRRGHESLLIAGSVPEGEEDMGYFAAEHKVRPVYIRQMSRELSAKDATSLLKIYLEIRRFRPDIIHTHTAKAGTVGRAAAFLYKWGTPGALIGKPRSVKVVHTFHGHVLHSYYGAAKTAVFRNIERVLARLATDRIIVISPQQFSELHIQNRIGKTADFSVVPLGIDLEAFITASGDQTLRAELGVDTDTIIVGCVGRLTEIKDIPLLISSAMASGDRPAARRLHFAILGDGHLRAELEGKVRELHAEGKITFLGNRPDVARLVGGMDIVALTSLNEGTPLSLIEAMAAGKTVVAAPVGGVVDLLGDAIERFDGFDVCQRGISVTRRTPVDFASALIYAAENEKLRSRLFSEGRQFVQENYSVDRLERDIEKLYSELLNEGSRT